MSQARRNWFPVDEMRQLAPRAAFPLTICVLFYGKHPDLCCRFLQSLYRFTDPAAFQLRAGLNEVCDETEQAVISMSQAYGNISIHKSEKNIFKCPMMRRLFHEPGLDTEWTLWFDDDSFLRGPGWIIDLGIAMEKLPDVELFGSLRSVGVGDNVEEFIESASWYRGVPREVRKESGERFIRFPVGGFWVVRTERIQEIDWPDPRLLHFQTDYTMGEAMRQQGVQMANFESGVCIDDGERRGPAGIPFRLRVDHSDPV